MIRSRSLYYRELTADDATQVYADWLNDPEVNRGLETRHGVQTVQSCREYIASMNNTGADRLFGMFLSEPDRHIGNIKIGRIHPRYGNAEVSLFIGDKSVWGRGLATEAVLRMTQWAFADLALERLEAGCYENNLGSLRAFLKVGYTVEGYFRKKVVSDGRRIGCFFLGMLRSEFRNS